MGDRLGTPGAVGFFSYKVAIFSVIVVLCSIEFKHVILRSISDHILIISSSDSKKISGKSFRRKNFSLDHRYQKLYGRVQSANEVQ